MGEPGHLRIGIRHDGDGHVILALAGELDMASAPTLEGALQDDALARGEALILDLEELGFIDSTGLRAVLQARQLCRDRGQQFAVTPGSQQVQRVLTITGLAEHLPVVAPQE